MSELCPLECVNIACKDASFMEKHETFILTVIGIVGSGFGVLFAYFLKSRCKKIKVCFALLSCDRVPPVDLPIETVEVNLETESAIA
jgi:hypothetical protein